MVLNGQAAMTIMGDWGKGYANAAHFDEQTVRRDADAGDGQDVRVHDGHVRDADGRLHKEDTLNMLKVFGSREGQDVFNPKKGSISARRDSHIDDTRVRCHGEADVR